MKNIRMLVIIGLLCFTGCAVKPYVLTDYENTYNFASLKTFSIKATKSDTKENLLISPFTFSHIHSLIDNELSKKYQATSEESKADFYVSYNIVMEEKIDPNSYDDLYGVGMWGGGYRYPSPLFYHSNLGAGIRVYNQGSLIIDMFDAKTKQPIWRGLSEKRLNKELSAQKQREILTSAVTEILSQFPPIK